LIGAVLALVLSKHPERTVLHRIPPVPDIVLLVIVVFGYLMFNWAQNGNALLFSAAVALLIASLVTRKGYVRSLLEHPALVFVGKRSYSFYLIHVLAIDVVESVLGRFVTLNWAWVVGVAFVLSLAGASLMHSFIELPCIALGRRLTERFARHEPVSEAAT
jgi:peptidoglycan/LPS O-acetylase OafA/YrhL